MRHAPESPVWVAFARSMAPMMMMASQGMAEIVVGNERRTLKVLDIAGRARAVWNSSAACQPESGSHRRGLEERAGGSAGERKEVRSRGSLQESSRKHFDVDIGTGYDLILVPNFLHHFDEPTIALLLNKLHTAR